MPRCLACRRTVPADLVACPQCRAPLLAPGLRDAGVEPVPVDSLAPTLFTGERLGPEVDLTVAITGADDGAVLELGPGVFRLRHGLTLRQAIVLNGAGAAQTRIVSDAPDFVLRVLADGLLRAQGIAFAHEGRKPADVLVVEGGEIDLVDCGVAGGFTADLVREAGAAGKHGRGLLVSGTACATVARCTFEDNAREGLAVVDDAVASVRGWTSRRNRGLGVLAAGRARLSLQDGRAETNYLGGVMFRDDSRGDVAAAVCRRGGFGVAVFHRAEVAITGCELSENARTGLAWWHAATGSARGCRVENNGEHGIEVSGEASVRVTENTVRGNRAWGLVFADRGTGATEGNTVSGNGAGDLRVLDAAKPRIGLPAPHPLVDQ